MELKDIPNGSKVFIDASIFLTVALKRPKRYVKACREFLAKVEKKEVEAFISNLVLKAQEDRCRGVAKAFPK